MLLLTQTNTIGWAMYPPATIKKRAMYLIPTLTDIMLSRMTYPTVVKRQPIRIKPERCLVLSLAIAEISAHTVAKRKIGIDMICARIDVQPSCLRMVGVKKEPE